VLLRICKRIAPTSVTGFLLRTTWKVYGADALPSLHFCRFKHATTRRQNHNPFVLLTSSSGVVIRSPVTIDAADTPNEPKIVSKTLFTSQHKPSLTANQAGRCTNCHNAQL
jgi:hypothetical protein